MTFCLNARRILYTAAFCAVLTLVPNCFAGSKVLFNFYPAVGSFPENPVYRDAAGNLFGMTQGDGPNTYGTVFALTQQPSGSWQNTTLHAFTYADAVPVGGLVADAVGNLYGATCGGSPDPSGEVFQLSPLPGGGWNYEVIYEFNNTNGDVADPSTTPVIDAAGNIYGAAKSGGHSRGGGVYKLTPQSDGTWQESVIYNFLGGNHTPTPQSLALGPDGDLYGTLEYGGAQYVGSIYRLSPSLVGNWTETTILSMSMKTKDSPRLAAGLAFDNAGNIVGTSLSGATSDGSLFELPHNPDGTWGPVITIRNFSGADGSRPEGDPIVDSANNIYGTTRDGGTYTLGVVYKFSPNVDGGWTGVLLHSFGSYFADGRNPHAGPILDSNGNVYGTTYEGGIGGPPRSANKGIVWEITP